MSLRTPPKSRDSEAMLQPIRLCGGCLEGQQEEPHATLQQLWGLLPGIHEVQLLSLEGQSTVPQTPPNTRHPRGARNTNHEGRVADAAQAQARSLSTKWPWITCWCSCCRCCCCCCPCCCCLLPVLLLLLPELLLLRLLLLPGHKGPPKGHRLATGRLFQNQ